jgi:hypothetical protein
LLAWSRCEMRSSTLAEVTCCARSPVRPGAARSARQGTLGRRLIGAASDHGARKHLIGAVGSHDLERESRRSSLRPHPLEGRARTADPVFAFASLRLNGIASSWSLGPLSTHRWKEESTFWRDHIWRFIGDTPFPSGPIMPLGRPFNQIVSKLRQYRRLPNPGVARRWRRKMSAFSAGGWRTGEGGARQGSGRHMGRPRTSLNTSGRRRSRVEKPARRWWTSRGPLASVTARSIACSEAPVLLPPSPLRPGRASFSSSRAK